MRKLISCIYIQRTILFTLICNITELTIESRFTCLYLKNLQRPVHFLVLLVCAKHFPEAPLTNLVSHNIEHPINIGLKVNILQQNRIYNIGWNHEYQRYSRYLILPSSLEPEDQNLVHFSALIWELNSKHFLGKQLICTLAQSTLKKHNFNWYTIS